MAEAVLTTERLDELFASFPLQPGDVVWLVGGHQGLQVQFLLDTYPGISLDVYEPQLEWYAHLAEKFEGMPVRVHPYALGDRVGKLEAGLQGQDCTFHWQHLRDAGLIEGPTKSLWMELVVQEYLDNPNNPTLLMMNCEGSELEIIKELGFCGVLQYIPCVLTQFHSRVLGIEGCQEAYDILEETHDIRWRYNEWAWVYAEVKEN